MSFQAWIAKQVIAIQFRNWSKGSVSEQRRRQTRNTNFTRLPPDIRCTPINADGIPAEWIEMPGAKQGVLLYLHGGGYALGSIDTHREVCARLANATHLRVLAIDYRLAPEHPYPAALEDSQKAYRWILAQGVEPAQTVIAGDSAGGGLALATLVTLRDAGEPLPAGAFLISPWLDLAHTGTSFKSNARKDPILKQESSKMYAGWYAGEQDLTNPLISPLYAALHDLPPTLIQVSTDEILLDDSTRCVERFQEAGVEVDLEIWEGVFHVFQIVPFLPESKEALENIVEFTRRVLQSGVDTPRQGVSTA